MSELLLTEIEPGRWAYRPRRATRDRVYFGVDFGASDSRGFTTVVRMNGRFATVLN